MYNELFHSCQSKDDGFSVIVLNNCSMLINIHLNMCIEGYIEKNLKKLNHLINEVDALSFRLSTELGNR